MRRSCLLALAAGVLMTAGARASDPMGIYALIDKVVLSPQQGPAERIQIWGTFVLASQGGNQRTQPQRGYLDFSLVPGKEQVCRREWADLKKVAGAGQVVAFGSSRAPTGFVHRPRTSKPTAPPLDADKLKSLIAELDSDNFAVRERATHQLEAQGAHAQPALRKALEGKPSAEARRRMERLLHEGEEKPDPYPLGFGLLKLEGDYAKFWLNQFHSLPEPAAPGEGAAVETGTVKLKTKNIANTEHLRAGYLFEIEDAAGKKEVSPVIAAGDKETSWTPKMTIEAGKAYRWSVRPVDGEWKGPAAESSFVGKSAS